MMKNEIKIVHREHKDNNQVSVIKFGFEKAKKVRRFHQSFPGYKETPLVNLTALADELGLKNLLVKDESKRFGLNAFKVLGGSYALGNYIAQKLNLSIDDLSFDAMTSDDVKEQLGKLTFVTATDGNHGRGIAWTARQLGQKAVVYMPKGAQKVRLDNILAENADACITNLSYDDAVRMADEHAQKYGWVLVQDTAWEGYEEIPAWIMEGYTTMIYEAILQMQEMGVSRPTHVFLQAGVGSMAGAVCAFLVDLFGVENRLIITVVEPQKADCNFQTACADDGELHFVTGEMDTMMAGLACGEPCTISWDILRDYADNFISCPDDVAARGMRILGNPLPGDMPVISGESGAVSTGLVAEIMKNPELHDLKKTLKLDAQSVVICLSTEGDTDPGNYRDILMGEK
jgi:diaminopropionate ammonia-lyase